MPSNQATDLQISQSPFAWRGLGGARKWRFAAARLLVADGLPDITPNPTTYRFAVEDVEIGGVTIRKNELVLASLLSANHDESRFPDPDRFDVGRKPNKHIAFGYGIHFCLGAPLARLEAVIAVETLLRRLPRMKLAVPREDLEPSSMLLLLHAKKRLPVQF